MLVNLRVELFLRVTNTVTAPLNFSEWKKGGYEVLLSLISTYARFHNVCSDVAVCLRTGKCQPASTVCATVSGIDNIFFHLFLSNTFAALAGMGNCVPTAAIAHSFCNFAVRCWRGYGGG